MSIPSTSVHRTGPAPFLATGRQPSVQRIDARAAYARLNHPAQDTGAASSVGPARADAGHGHRSAGLRGVGAAAYAQLNRGSATSRSMEPVAAVKRKPALSTVGAAAYARLNANNEAPAEQDLGPVFGH